MKRGYLWLDWVELGCRGWELKEWEPSQAEPYPTYVAELHDERRCDSGRVADETEADMAALQHAAEDAELREAEEEAEAFDQFCDEHDSHYECPEEQRFGR